MAGATFDDRHLDAIREVVVATAMIAEGAVLPWAVLDALGRLLRCQEVVLVGLDHGLETRWFRQTSRDGRRLGDDPVEDGAERPAWQHLWASTHGPPGQRAPSGPPREKASAHELAVPVAPGAGRQLRLLCRRAPDRAFTDRDRFDLQLLLPHIEEAYRRGERRRSTPELTDRQRELLELVAEGGTNRQIGRCLGISEATVRTHLNNVYARLGVRCRMEAVSLVLARQHVLG